MLKDEMTPKERMAAFSKGEPIDRIPIVPDMGVTMSDFIGATTREYYTSAKVMAECEISLFKRLRHDSVSISTTLRGMAEAMGSIIEYPVDNISYLAEPLIKEESDLGKLKIINPWKDGKLPLLLEALQRIREETGKEADIGASMTGPFSVAASVLGTERLLKWMVRKPEAVHSVLEIIETNNEEYINALSSIGFSAGFCDPVSSTSLLSIKQFREFSLPYLKKNISHCIKKTGSHPAVHICGKSRELWNDLIDAGCGNWSIDNCEDLGEAVKVIGDRCTITGNVPPVEVMLLGNREDVYESVKKSVEKARGTKKGYILSTGCQIPKGTPFENIEAFMEAGRLYGRNPELFR